MPQQTKRVGLIGLGNMGKNIAARLHQNGYSLVIFNKTKDAYDFVKDWKSVQLADEIGDFAKKIRTEGGEAIIWMMIPGGEATNNMVSRLSDLLAKNDIVIDASNSIYPDSIANYERLKGRGICYLDVGCAGGPEDLLNGVALMVGGDKIAFENANDVFRSVAGNGTYGYIGKSGSGHMTKLVHNGIFYGIFPIYAEGVELLQKMRGKEFDMDEALRLLRASPPINNGIMTAIKNSMNDKEAQKDAPQIKVSDMINWEAGQAEKFGVSFSITRAVLSGYSSMSEGSRRIYAAAKRIITGH